MYKINKTFKFDAGHRVPTQHLDIKHSCNTPNKCKHMHGHEYKIDVCLTSSMLHDGMVLDFNNLNFFKKFIDQVLDHKFILWVEDDLLINMLFKNNDIIMKSINKFKLDKENTYDDGIINKVKLGKSENKYDDILIIKGTDISDDLDERDLYESFVIVKFIPTAEELSYFLYKQIYNYFEENGLSTHMIESVTVHETSTSTATYKHKERINVASVYF